MVKELDVRFPSFVALEGFVRLNSVSKCSLYIKAGRLLLDATDIMNLFTLDLLNSVRVRIEGQDESVYLLLNAYDKAGIKYPHVF